MKKIILWSVLAVVLFGVMPAAAGPGDEISQALAGLQSPDAQVKARAHARLVCLDRGAVPELIRLFGDETCPVRPELARILGEIGAEEAIDPLIHILQSCTEHEWELYGSVLDGLSLFKDKKVVEALIKEFDRMFEKANRHSDVSQTLAKIGPFAIPNLIAALHDKSDSIRSGAITTLGNMKAKEALQPLIEIIKGPNQWITVDAATALGSLGDEGKKVLRCLAKDESSKVRGIAIKGLVKNLDYYEFDLCQAIFDDYWSVCMMACDAFWLSIEPAWLWTCSPFDSYLYQANRLEMRTVVPIILDSATGEKESIEPIRIMVAVDAKGTVKHAWIMGDNVSTTARAALAAVKRFQFEPLVINGQAIPVRTVMTLMRSSDAGGDSLQVGFESPGNHEINSITYCYSPIRVKPVRLSFPEIPLDMQKKEIQGTVIMEAETDIYGRIKSCRVLSDSHPDLERLVKAALLKWVYEPYYLSGIPKPHLIQGHFHFLPNGIVAVKEQVIR